MRPAILRLPSAAFVAALAILGPASAQSPDAAKGRLFVIPASSGYGISDCFAPGSSCGKVVADAWCEAHGRGASLAFGRGEDVTASISTEQRGGQRIAPDAVVVSCAD